MKKITITKVAALRLAVTLASAQDYKPEFRSVVLEAGGRLIASNGFALIVSNNAHDAIETTFLTFQKKPRILKNTTRLTVSNSILTEEAGKTTKHHPVAVSTEGKYAHPDALLTTLAGPELKVPSMPFDAIKAGRLATDYGLESPRGIWLPTCNPRIVHLGDAHEDDLVVIATIVDGHAPENRFLKREAPPAVNAAPLAFTRATLSTPDSSGVHPG